MNYHVHVANHTLETAKAIEIRIKEHERDVQYQTSEKSVAA